MLFEILLLKLNGTEFIRGDSILGPICFTLFVFVTIFILLNIFISILTDNFRFVSKQTVDEQQIFSFMKQQIDRVRRLFVFVNNETDCFFFIFRFIFNRELTCTI